MISNNLLRFGVFVVFGCSIFYLPNQTSYSATRNRDYDFEYEDARNWGRQSSQTRRKINSLDDDPVKEIPIPILFGVELSNLYPNFGDDRDGGSRSHMGLDIMSPEGTPIVSPTEAVVLRTGNGTNSGKYVYTANPGGETFVYMHLSEIADIDSGDVLDVGDVIGYVGNTGNASGGPAHLHFEIREDGKASDPYKRIEETFSLKNKIKYLDGVFDDYSNDKKMAEFLVANFSNTFTSAVRDNIDLPKEIVDAMKKVGTVVSPSYGSVPVRDLELGARGDDVVWLQKKLIEKNIGPSAKVLSEAGATGYFGPITTSAVIEYQLANKISPAVGYFGPITRASMIN